MIKICLTGGPCGGKSSALAKLEATLTSRGYKVFVVPETATELLANGITPCENITMDDFQNFVLDKQLAKESLYDKVATYFDSNKVICIYDRGLSDQLAYISKEKFIKMLEKRNLTLNDVTNRYDLVLHLVTSADGTDCYEWAGSEHCKNMARSESPEEAIIKDKATLNGWISAGCTHLKVIDNSTNFDGKINKILREVFTLLDENAPSEIERKFLIRKPSLETLNSIKTSSKSNIIQTYLRNEDKPEVERRIRQRGTKENGYNFYLTEKIDKAKGERIELERKIFQREYLNYMTESDTTLHQISKTRYCFIYEKQFFELDIYPETMSKDFAILEIELNNIDDKVVLPPFLDIVKDVTEDKSYRNHSLAKTMEIKD